MAEQRPAYIDGLEVAAIEMRRGVLGQGGVFGAGDLAVTAGAGNTVDVAAGQAFIDNNFGAFQGRYAIVNDATKNSANFEGGGIPAPGAQPAVHQIVAKIWDPAFEAVGVGGRRWRLMVVPGVPTSGATIDNRSGAVGGGAATNSPQLAADPWRNTLRLADVHQTSAGVLTIRDRRPWARGIEYSSIWNGGNRTLIDAVMSQLQPAPPGFTRRVEVGANGLIQVSIGATGLSPSATTAGWVGLGFAVDGTVIQETTAARLTNAAVDYYTPLNVLHPHSVTPGSHLVEVRGRKLGGTSWVILGAATQPISFEIRERLSANSGNGSA